MTTEDNDETLWKCCGCGAHSPGRLRVCDCPTEVLYVPGNSKRSALKIEPKQNRESLQSPWRSFESAPRDGRYIIAQLGQLNPDHRFAHLSGRCFVVRYEGRTARIGLDMGWSICPGIGGFSDWYFSLWMPLPPVPGMRTMTEFGHFAAIGRGVCIDAWGAGPFEITVGRKNFTFEDSDRFGPLILDRRGMPADDQPPERSKFWMPYHMWLKGGRRLADDGKTCIWDMPKPTTVKRVRFKEGWTKVVVETGDLDFGGVVVLPE